MNKNELAAIKAYCKERDAMLLAGTIEAYRAFQAKHAPKLPIPSDHVVEVSIHKMRTAVKSLPYEVRMASKKWLLEHNYEPWDDKELQ